MSRRELAAILGLLALATLLRAAAAQQTPFYDWDAGLFYARVADDLGPIFAGHADSQYGALHPVYPMIGLSVATRALTALTGLTTFAAGQLLVGSASVALVALAWWLGRRLEGPTTGLLAALLVAADGTIIDHSTRSVNVVPCAAALAASFALVLRGERTRDPSRRSLATLAAAALAGVTVWLRADAAITGLVLVSRVALGARAGRTSRATALGAVAVWAVAAGGVVGLQATVAGRNDAARYLTHVHADARFNAGLYPDAYFVDATGLTLRIASSPPDVTDAFDLARLGKHGEDVALALARAIGGILLGALAALAVLGRERRAEAGWLFLFGVGPLAGAVAAGAPPVDMLRYSLTARPVLLVLAAAALVAALDRARTVAHLSAELRRAIGVLVVLAIVAGIWPSSVLEGLASWGRGGRARSEHDAAVVASVLPRGTRVARGPWGDTIIVAMAGGRPVHLATGPTPEAIAGYVRGNELEWITYGEREGERLARLLPGLVLEPVVTFANPDGPQVLARIHER